MSAGKTPAQEARRATLRPDGTPVRVTRRRAQTRARLLDAAFGVFAARGFGRVSIEDVCEAAGYTRGAFYSNFDSLDELFFALYEQRSKVIADHVAGALDPAPHDLRAALARVLDALVVDRDWILVKTDFLLHAARIPAVGAELRCQRGELLSALAATLAAAVDTATLPAPLHTPEGLARAVSAIHDGAMEQLLLYPDVEAQRKWLGDLLAALLD